MREQKKIWLHLILMKKISKNTDDLKIRVGIHTEEQFKLAVKYPEISALAGDYESFHCSSL